MIKQAFDSPMPRTNAECEKGEAFAALVVGGQSESQHPPGAHIPTREASCSSPSPFTARETCFSIQRQRQRYHGGAGFGEPQSSSPGYTVARAH